MPRTILTLCPLALTLIGFSIPTPSLGQPLCPGTDDLTPASNTRTVELEQFGIRVKIPSNFRTLLRNDGSVSIVAPGDFNLLRCIAEGMPVQGTDAVSMETLRLRPNPENLDLKTFVLKDATPNLSDQVEAQTVNEIDVLIRQRNESKDGIALAYGVFQVDEIDGVVEVTVETKDQLLNLLDRIQLLTTEPDPVVQAQDKLEKPDNLIVQALNAVKVLGYTTESDRETILRENDSPENVTQSIVTITQEGLLDDSIAGQQFTIQFQKNTSEQWEIVTVKKTRKCQPDRGSQIYSTEPCL